MWSNAGERGNSVVIRGVDAWEQNHWWWDDTRYADAVADMFCAYIGSLAGEA